MPGVAAADSYGIARIGGEGRFPLLEPFRYRAWVRVWLASLVSQLGDWMQIFARAALAYRLTGRPSSVGWIYFASYLPQLLLSLWGGVLADRFDRRRLLIGCQVAQMAGAFVMGLLVVTGTATLLNIALLSFAIGLALTLNIPAGQALGPAVVARETLASAISLWTATGALCRVLGPVLAAALVRPLGIEWIFWINALSFLAVIFAWVATRVPRQPRLARDVPNLDAMRDAFGYVRRHPRVWVPIVVSAFLASVGIVYQPLIIPYATSVLSGGARTLGETRAGFLQGAIGFGAAVGILGLASLGRRRPGPTLLGSAVVFSAMLVVLGRVSAFPVALVVCFALGAMQFANMTLAINLVQHDVPEVMRGRVMSIQIMGLIGLVPIASLAGGAIADRIGIPALLTGAGACCVVFSLWALRWERHVVMRVAPESPETIAAVHAVLEEEG
jgi:MFS family permease